MSLLSQLKLPSEVKLYPPSVIVSVTNRIDSSAILRITAEGSSGAYSSSTIDPITCAEKLPSASGIIKVYNPSCSDSTSYIVRSDANKATPQIPQLIAIPCSNNSLVRYA